jgi:putative redox protein
VTEARGKTLSVESTWQGGYRCLVRSRQFEIQVDEPVGAGGEDTGPQPSEVFLASLASCFTLAIYHVARKRDIALEELTVRATGEYQGPKFTRLVLEVASSSPRHVIEPLLERAKGVCYVSNTLRAVSDVEVLLTGSPLSPPGTSQTG